MRFGVWEIVTVIAVIILLFGARRLPELARALGRSLNEFKKGRAEGMTADSEAESEKKPHQTEKEPL